MSLENEIVKLRQSIEKLSVLMEGVQRVKVDVNDMLVDQPPEYTPSTEQVKLAIAPAPAPAPAPAAYVAVDPVEPSETKITIEKAAEVNKKMIEIAHQLGTQEPLKQLLIEFKILKITDLLVSQVDVFMEKMEAM